MFVPSRYNVLIPLTDDRVLAYNAVKGGLAVWDPDDAALFAALTAPEPSVAVDETSPVLGQLEQGGYLVPEDTDELAELEDAYRAKRFGSEGMTLTIAPTLACNFGCSYCYQGADKPTAAMSPAVQDRVVALIERHAATIRHLSIGWYGGEPLMARDVVESLSDRLIALCQDRGIHYSAMIVTNGYFLTPDVAHALHIRGVKSIQVTLDGSEAAHDARRALTSGKPTFRRIVDNLKQIVATVPVRLSVRVNVDGGNDADVHELLDQLRQAGLAGKDRLKVYFAPIEAVADCSETTADQALPRAAYAATEVSLYRASLDSKLSHAQHPPKFHSSCAGVRPLGFVVVPNGDLFRCWHAVSQPEHKVGTVFDLAGLEGNAMGRRWLDWTPFADAECRACKLLPVCAGSCAYKALHPDQMYGESAVRPCLSWRYNINERLLQQAEAAGAIHREDFDPAAVATDPDAVFASFSRL